MAQRPRRHRSTSRNVLSAMDCGTWSGSMRSFSANGPSSAETIVSVNLRNERPVPRSSSMPCRNAPRRSTSSRKATTDTPRCSATRLSRVKRISRSTSAQFASDGRASIATSHSLSKPSDRLLKLDEPMRSSRSSTTMIFEWMYTDTPRPAAGQYTPSRPWRSAFLSNRTRTLASAVHRLDFQAALRAARQNDHDLGPVALPVAAPRSPRRCFGRRSTDSPVDDVAGGTDRSKIQRLDLAGLAALGQRWKRARHPHLDVAQRGRSPSGQGEVNGTSLARA